jgi:hypothetical protein
MVSKKKNGTLLAKKTLLTEQPRLTKYIPKDTQKAVALNYGNTETQRDILLKHIESRFPDLASIFNDNYYAEIDEFIMYIESKNVREVEIATSKKMGLGGKKIAFETKKSDAKTTPMIKSKTKTGKVYNRVKTPKFENKKVTIAFIKKRTKEGKSNKEITKEYNTFARSRNWNERTQSSITTFKSRNKIKKPKSI